VNHFGIWGWFYRALSTKIFQRLISWRRKQHVPPNLCSLFTKPHGVSSRLQHSIQSQPWGLHVTTFTSDISFFRSWQLLSYSNFSHFMEPQRSLPCSQELA